MKKEQIFSQDVLFHSWRRIWRRNSGTHVVVLSSAVAIPCSSSSVLPEPLWVQVSASVLLPVLKNGLRQSARLKEVLTPFSHSLQL